MKMRSSCIFALVFGVAFNTFGACGDDPSNLLRFSNCGFDLDTSGWALVRGDLFVQHPGEGYSEAGAGYVDPTYYPSITRYEFELDGPCVPVLNFTEYDIGAYVKSFGAVSCGVSLFEYSGATCTGWVTGCGGPIIDSSGNWVLVENQCTTSPTTQSARLHFNCWNASFYQALLDDAFIVQNVTIFADGFESGNTWEWSSTMP